MGKITQVNDGDTGLQARTKINEAVKTVETDGTISGDGTLGNPLKVDNTPLLFWQYNDSTSDVNPGSGKFLIGSGFLNISASLFGTSGLGVGNLLGNIKAGSTIVIQSRTNNELAKSINVTGDSIFNGNYYKIPIAIFDEDQAFVLGDIFGFQIFPKGDTTTEIAAPTISANVLDIDFKGKNNYETSAEVAATSNFAVTVSNDTNARNAHVDLYITNAITITLPANSLMQDDENRWTPSPTYQIAVDGLTGASFELSFRKVGGTKLKWILSQKFE